MSFRKHPCRTHFGPRGGPESLLPLGSDALRGVPPHDAPASGRGARRTGRNASATPCGRDLHKSPEEAYLTEISIVRGEIRSHLRHLGKWMRPERRPSPLKLLPSKSRILSQPLGQALDRRAVELPRAAAAQPARREPFRPGCTALLKPSPYTPHVAEALERMIAEIYDEAYVAVAQGGREVNALTVRHALGRDLLHGKPRAGTRS